jgi:PEP-CTERM motif
MIHALFLTLTSVIAFSVGPVFAATVFDNGPPDNNTGTQMSAFVVADDFTLASATNMTNIRFWSAQSAQSDYLGSVAWSIYSDVGSLPSATLFSGTSSATGVATGDATGFGYSIYAFDIPVSFSLAAGSYWLGLNNSPLESVNPTDMLWASKGSIVGREGVYLDGASWAGTDQEHAFRLDGNGITSAVPEPYMPAMMLAGIAALAGLRRIQRIQRPEKSSSQ